MTKHRSNPLDDRSICPLCGERNDCAAVRGTGPAPACWCREVAIAPEVIARIPAAQRGLACICPRCAAAASATTYIDQP